MPILMMQGNMLAYVCKWILISLLRLQYEGLNMICFASRKLGHKCLACPAPLLNLYPNSPVESPASSFQPSHASPKSNSPLKSNLNYHPNSYSSPSDPNLPGPWMVVRRSKLPTPSKVHSKSIHSSAHLEQISISDNAKTISGASSGAILGENRSLF